MPDQFGADDGSDGWEDVANSQAGGAGGTSGQIGSGGGEMSDAMTTAMMSHFARELTKGSLMTSLWPQFALAAGKCFNVNHGYVLRKLVWQLVPVTPPKSTHDGELGGGKDWTMRIYQGLEVPLEEPDMYIPTMAFVTYVLLCGVVQGLRGEFHPDVLSNTITFAAVLLIVELAIFKGALFMAGAVDASSADIAALLGYKYFYLSMQVLFGLLICHEGFIFCIVCLGLAAAACGALYQTLRRLARMQPKFTQDCVPDAHKILIKALPAVQLLFFWFLLPAWPKRAAVAAIAKRAAVTVAPPMVTAASTLVKAAANASGA